MLRGTGFPAVPSRLTTPAGGILPGHRFALAAAALAAVIVCSGFPAAANPRDEDSAVDPRIAASMETITRAFRTGSADLLTSTLPEEGKVFLSLSTVGNEAGYYGRGQVYFIFQRIFGHQKTIHFKLRPHDGDKDTQSGLVYLIGGWTYSRPDGRDGDTMMHFVLSIRKGSCFLVQIREAQ